jgi:EAL domain-containing protein (putative c-di-GMP-specific phosphodiesterase class I)
MYDGAAHAAFVDIITSGMCIMMIILIRITSIVKNKKYYLLSFMLLSTWITCGANIIFNSLINDPSAFIPVYLSRFIFHFSLIVSLTMYINYLYEPFWLNTGYQRRYMSFSVIVLVGTTFTDLMATMYKFGFYLDDRGRYISRFNPFIIYYILLYVTILYIIIKYRTKVIKKIFLGLFSIDVIAIMILLVQAVYNNNLFTSFSVFIMEFGLMFMFHSNPYDNETGSASETAFIKTSGTKTNPNLVLISCTMNGFDEVLRSNEELKITFNEFFRSNVRKGVFYKCYGERYILVFNKNKVDNYQTTIHNLLTSFRAGYEKFLLDYKIVICESENFKADPKDYLRLFEYLESKMPLNTEKFVTQEDVKEFRENSYIYEQLQDIVYRRDLNDPRVLVYCQPILNIKTGCYDTAEALMRLKLPEYGMVYPDKFISLAEQFNLIHTLTLIMLNKTCAEIKKLMEENYLINRVSINFSVIDIKYQEFCNEVQSIIQTYEIPYNKIAVEITESRNDADFNLMKSKISELKAMGMKLYLDDFGTGYSNIERIMELPFDIIKFDRSMLIESAKSTSSKFMIETFANMFFDLNYSVLFEGVENENDEAYCATIPVNYLQGYKYSKPIPIYDLRNFLERDEKFVS